MKEKKPLYKKWWFWLIIVIIIGIVVPKKDTTTEEAPADVTEESVAETTSEGYETVISTKHEEWSEVETTDGGYQVSYKDISDKWDENSFVTECIRNYVKLSQAVYADDLNCKFVKLYIFVDLTDSKGNTSSSKAISMTMTQEEFNTYYWDNLEYSKIYEQFKESCEDFFIAPGIEKNIDTDKIYYY